MKDVLDLEPGRHPWHPNTSVGLGEVLDEYNVPLAGLLHDGGRTILFTNLVGDAEPTGMWAYAVIGDGELQALLAASDAKSFDAAVAAALTDRCVTVAAVIDHRIEFSSTLDAGLEGPRGLSDRFFDQVDRRIRRVDAASHTVRDARRPVLT